MRGRHSDQVVRKKEIIGIEHGQQWSTSGLDGAVTSHAGSLVPL
jgi:hypothetical protein